MRKRGEIDPAAIVSSRPAGVSLGSGLEAALLFAVRAVGLPEPEREYAFDWCCPWSRRLHRAADSLIAHEYHHGRAWRFDFAWPSRLVAVEVEGGVHSGGRHTRGAGFTADAEKYNEAALRGWKVLRVTGEQIESGDALAWIERALSEGE